MNSKQESPGNSYPGLSVIGYLAQGLHIGLSVKKVGIAILGVLAANGLMMALVALFAPSGPPPVFVNDEQTVSWNAYKLEISRWNLWHEVAGIGGTGPYSVLGLADLAQSQQEYIALTKGLEEDKPFDPSAALQLKEALAKLALPMEGVSPEQAKNIANQLGRAKPSNRLGSWLWSEDRGPNPVLALGGPGASGVFERFSQLVKSEISFVLEPLCKVFLPLYYLIHPNASAGQRLFFLGLLGCIVSVWTLIGGMISRIAAFEFTRKQTISVSKAFGYVKARRENYLLAPWLPLVPGGVILLGMVVFGFFHMIPWVGDILFSGLGWVVMLVSGLVLTVISFGLLGWPIMTVAISVDSDDAFAATTKPYSYLGQKGWFALGAGLFCTVYSAICLIFVCWVASVGVYLAKWGVAQTPGVVAVGRSPEFLFVYAPTTFGWRTLLLEGAQVGGNSIVENGAVNPQRLEQYRLSLTANQRTGAFLASGWLYLAVLPMIGLGYSFFWCFLTGIYLQLRKKTDDVEMQDIYLDEEDDPAFAPVVAPDYKPGTSNLTSEEFVKEGKNGGGTPLTTKPGAISLSVLGGPPPTP